MNLRTDCFLNLNNNPGRFILRYNFHTAAHEPGSILIEISFITKDRFLEPTIIRIIPVMVLQKLIIKKGGHVPLVSHVTTSSTRCSKTQKSIFLGPSQSRPGHAWRVSPELLSIRFRYIYFYNYALLLYTSKNVRFLKLFTVRTEEFERMFYMSFHFGRFYDISLYSCFICIKFCISFFLYITSWLAQFIYVVFIHFPFTLYGTVARS